MTDQQPEYFLFVGAVDTESATTKLRADGAVYRKKLLSSRPENWREIVELIVSTRNRGTLVVLTGNDYTNMCRPEYEDVAGELLDALAGHAHVIFVHEAVFLSDEQRAAADAEHVDRASVVKVSPRFTDEDYFGMSRDDFFGSIPDAVRQRVNATLRDRALDVVPYRSNVERSIIATSFLEDHERHLLFRLYVPRGRLYAQEAEALLSLFREWLGQTGRSGIRQEGYSTTAGQVFEFFSGDGEPPGGLTRSFQDFSSFLDSCVSEPDIAASQLAASGVSAAAATTVVSRFATQARRLTLDLRHRREERILSLKHQLENVMLEVEGLEGDAVAAVLEELLPRPIPGGILAPSSAALGASLTVNNYSPQFVSQVAGPVIQNVAGTVNLGQEARQLLELVAAYGEGHRGQLETAVHELEDDGARSPDRLAARGRLKRFLADLSNRGVGMGLDVLQKYVEHKVGVS